MPTENGVGSDERGDFGGGAPADGLASYGQSASLIICQTKSSATELLFQDSVLLTEILDDRILLTGDPAGQSGNEDLSRLKDDGHRFIVVTLGDNRQLSADADTR
jgi:hypothetical protein